MVVLYDTAFFANKYFFLHLNTFFVIHLYKVLTKNTAFFVHILVKNLQNN